MPAGKVTKATKKVKSSKGFGKAIATQKKIGRVKRSKDERLEKSIKAEAKATKVVPVLARHDSAQGRGQGHKASRGKSPGFQEGMKVDDFLESGFEQAMAEVSSDEDGEEEAAAAAAAASKPKKEKMSAQLKKLKESDPAFYEYMQKTDQALLEFGSDEEGEEEDDEEDEAAAAGASEAAMMGDGDDDEEDEDEDEAAIPDTDEEDEEEAPRKKGKAGRARPQVEVTTALVKEWEQKLLKGESAAALKQLVAAFRCAVHYGDDDGGEHADDTPYTFTSGSAAGCTCWPHVWLATYALLTQPRAAVPAALRYARLASLRTAARLLAPGSPPIPPRPPRPPSPPSPPRSPRWAARRTGAARACWAQAEERACPRP